GDPSITGDRPPADPGGSETQQKPMSAAAPTLAIRDGKYHHDERTAGLRGDESQAPGGAVRTLRDKGDHTEHAPDQPGESLRTCPATDSVADIGDQGRERN